MTEQGPLLRSLIFATLAKDPALSRDRDSLNIQAGKQQLRVAKCFSEAHEARRVTARLKL